ncbi:hypothetical protein M885DRAFT_32763 [Pelagophyceae sp. CCMP2097]|nr:hypothetical protein M885DRAFT_32763 [Pelagophyceae sp. CCMP2097]
MHSRAVCEGPSSKNTRLFRPPCQPLWLVGAGRFSQQAGPPFFMPSRCWRKAVGRCPVEAAPFPHAWPFVGARDAPGPPPPRRRADDARGPFQRLLARWFEGAFGVSGLFCGVGWKDVATRCGSLFCGNGPSNGHLCKAEDHRRSDASTAARRSDAVRLATQAEKTREERQCATLLNLQGAAATWHMSSAGGTRAKVPHIGSGTYVERGCRGAALWPLGQKWRQLTQADCSIHRPGIQCAWPTPGGKGAAPSSCRRAGSSAVHEFSMSLWKPQLRARCPFSASECRHRLRPAQVQSDVYR